MIKINLLREKDEKKPHRGFPKSFAVIPLAFIAIAATIYIVIVMGNRPKEQSVAQVEQKVNPQSPPADTHHVAKVPESIPSVGKKPETVTVAEPAKSAPAGKVVRPVSEPVRRPTEIKTTVAEIPPDTAKSKYAPSTHASEKVVEDVVSDRSRKNAADLLSLSYKEMSQGEKINYEVAFTKKMFELLTRSVPEGIEFSALAIDSFSVIRATGLGSSRELVGNLFRALRNEKNLTLREKPASSIRSLGAKGYRFDFICDAAFGIDTSEAYAVTSDLKPHENFSGMLRTFSSLVASDGIVLEHALERTGSEQAGKYRRYTYHMSGSSTYLGFVKLVLDLQKKRFPCSFNMVQLKARNALKIAFDADIVFTLLD